jgi:hypothetical protein
VHRTDDAPLVNAGGESSTGSPSKPPILMAGPFALLKLWYGIRSMTQLGAAIFDPGRKDDGTRSLLRG